LVNDVIVTFDGQDVPDTRDLVRMVGNAPVGKTVILEVLRAGELTEVGVTLGRRETAEAAVVAAAETEEEAPEVRDILGMTLSEITPEITEEYNVAVLDGLVIIDVTKGSDAAQKGLRVGDVLVEAGQQAVTSFDDLEARIAEATEAGRTSILVLVRRDGSPRFVPLSLE
jgi:serine protease Do